MSALSDFGDALQEITKCEGAFKRDPYEHAKSVISDMQRIAIDVLRKHGLEPRRDYIDGPNEGERP
jgi:hypothetical protein